MKFKCFAILHKNDCYSIFANYLNIHTAGFKQGNICFLSVMIIYLGSRNLVWTRKKPVNVDYKIYVIDVNCVKLFGEWSENKGISHDHRPVNYISVWLREIFADKIVQMSS